MKALVIIGSLLCLAAPAAAQSPRPAPVTVADLAFAQVPWGADTVALLRILGQPTKRGTYTWPGAAAPMAAWVYPEAEFDLDIGGSVLIASLRGPTAHTVRGVSIGDSARKVRRLYGAPTEIAGMWTYDARDDGSVALMFTIVAGKVTDIMAGTVPGMD